MIKENKLSISIIVASMSFLGWAFVDNLKERESLYKECLAEGVLSPFECKTAAYEMTRINN